MAELDENPVERTPEYRTWGQVASLNVWDAVWSSGAWLQFIPGVHAPKDKRVRIELLIIPIDEMNARYNVDQKFTQDSRDWASVTFPSIKALTVPLGIKVQDIVGRFVLVNKKPNGKTYDKKDATTGQPTGQKGTLSDLLFERIFASMDECTADYNGGVIGGEDFAPIAGDVPDTVAPAPAAATANPVPMKMYTDLALSFVKKAVSTYPGDFAKISEEVTHQIDVKNSKLFAGKLTASDEIVMNMIVEEMAK